MSVDLQSRISLRQPFTPFLSDKEVARILRMKVQWVRSHAEEIPGFRRISAQYRFVSSSVEKWLGSLEPLLTVEDVAPLVQMSPKWIFANKESLAGFMKLGRYVRFLPTEVRAALEGGDFVETEVVQ